MNLDSKLILILGFVLEAKQANKLLFFWSYMETSMWNSKSEIGESYGVKLKTYLHEPKSQSDIINIRVNLTKHTPPKHRKKTTFKKHLSC